eukprot:886686-Amphidinium_carterae.1
MVSDDESTDSQGSGHCRRHVIERAQRRKRREATMAEGVGTVTGAVVEGPTRPAPTKEEIERKRR